MNINTHHLNIIGANAPVATILNVSFMTLNREGLIQTRGLKA